MGIKLKTPEEIELLRESSLLVGKTLGEVSKHVAPGANTLALDKLAEEFIRDHGAEPAFKNYRGSLDVDPFPASLCVSLNDEVVHGIPTADKYLEEGDIVSIDCGVLLNGYYGDSAYTFPVGEISSKKRRLMKITRESLYKGLAEIKDGARMGDLSNAIQLHAESHGFSIVREMVGHGIGKELHEPPEVPNFGRRGTGVRLKEGMVIAVEPMVNMGKRRIGVDADGWTIRAADKQPSAHYEHSVAVTKDGCSILSTFEIIEDNIGDWLNN